MKLPCANFIPLGWSNLFILTTDIYWKNNFYIRIDKKNV